MSTAPPPEPNENAVRDALAARENGQVEVRTADGRVDVLTDKEVIEVKHVKRYKDAMGQVLCYGRHFPQHGKRVHLFGYARPVDYTKAFDAAAALGVRLTVETDICAWIMYGVPAVARHNRETGVDAVRSILIEMVTQWEPVIEDGQFLTATDVRTLVLKWATESNRDVLPLTLKAVGKCLSRVYGVKSNGISAQCNERRRGYHLSYSKLLDV